MRREEKRRSRITFPRRVVVDRSFQFRSVDTMLINDANVQEVSSENWFHKRGEWMGGSFYILADTFLYV